MTPELLQRVGLNLRFGYKTFSPTTGERCFFRFIRELPNPQPWGKWHDVKAKQDSGYLAPQAIDLEFVEWLVRRAVPFVFVFTKTDKVSALTAQKNITAFSERISAWFEKPPAVFTCSAVTRQGRHELLGIIDEEMAAINAAAMARAPAESSPTLSLEARLRDRKNRRPDLNCFW